MKKVVFNKLIFALTLLLAFILIPKQTTWAAPGTEVETVAASGTNGSMTVSGSSQDGVYAVAILVYDSTDTLVAMTTCAASNNVYSTTISVPNGTYTVKAANYDGGAYATTTASVSAVTTPTTPTDTPSEKTESSSSTTNTSATNTTASTTVGTVTDVTKSTENFQGAALAETPAELLANVLTAAEQTLVASGAQVKVWIDAKDISATVPAEQQALVVNSLPEKYEVAKYLDINLFKQVGNNASTKVTQLPNGNVAIRFVLPEDLRKDGRQYKVVRIHDGVATVLDATFDPATGLLSFETNQFSTYAIIYTDSAMNTKSPKTNNGVDFGAMLAVLLLCASSVYMVNRRKRA